MHKREAVLRVFDPNNVDATMTTKKDLLSGGSDCGLITNDKEERSESFSYLLIISAFSQSPDFSIMPLQPLFRFTVHCGEILELAHRNSLF